MSEDLPFNSSAYRQQLEINLLNLNLLIQKIAESLNYREAHLKEKHYKNDTVIKNLTKVHKKNKLSTVIQESITQQDAYSPRIITAPAKQMQSQNLQSIVNQIPQEHYQIKMKPCKSAEIPKTGTRSLSSSRSTRGLKTIVCCTGSVINLQANEKNALCQKSDQQNNIEKSQTPTSKSFRKYSSTHQKYARIDVQALKGSKREQNCDKSKRDRSKKGIFVLSNNKLGRFENEKKQNRELRKEQKKLQKLTRKGEVSEATKQNEWELSEMKKNKNRLSRRNIREFYVQRRINL